MGWHGIVCCCSFINRETSGVVSASYLSMRELFSTSGTLLIYLIITVCYLFLVVRSPPRHLSSSLTFLSERSSGGENETRPARSDFPSESTCCHPPSDAPRLEGALREGT